MPSGKPVVIGGVRYDSIAEACRDKNLNKYDLKYNTIMKRLERGASLEEAFLHDKRGRIIINGVEYSGIKEVLKDRRVNIYNISDAVLYKRLKEGYTIEQALSKGLDHSVQYNGKAYKTLYDICRDRNINKRGLHYDIVRERLARGESLEDIFGVPIKLNYKRKLMKGKSLVVNGKVYKSIQHACSDKELNKYNLKSWVIGYRLRSGYTPEEAFNTPLHQTGKKPSEII